MSVTLSLSTSRFLVSACIPVGHLHQTLSTDANIPWSMMPLICPNFIHLTSTSLKKEILSTAAIVPHVRDVTQEGLGMRTCCRSPSLLKNAHLCNFFLFLLSISEVRRIWAVTLSRLHESQTHQSGFWFLTMFWFPFQLTSQLDVWLYHWSQELQCSGLAEEQCWFLTVLVVSGLEEACIAQVLSCT